MICYYNCQENIEFLLFNRLISIVHLIIRDIKSVDALNDMDTTSRTDTDQYVTGK